MKKALVSRKLIFSAFFAAIAGLFGLSSVYSQTPSQKKSLRIQIWSELDEIPGVFSEDGASDEEEASNSAVSANPAVESTSKTAQVTAAQTAAKELSGKKDAFVSSAEADKRMVELFRYSISRARQITPFLMQGMLEGWTFDYVPYDKTRQVKEIFEMGQVKPYDKLLNPITYRDPVPLEQEGKLLCWATCDRTPMQQLAYERWASIVHPKIQGRGRGRVEDGFEGIQNAVEEAVKEAVREYWRGQTKNKPKEIMGTVLLIQDPRIYISEGQYVVDLDFFLQTDRIILYSNY
ncbi:MAG: hypothetical protein II611_05125 [Treponema sp.]|nr:hypothetical protein [Treponema sp.]